MQMRSTDFKSQHIGIAALTDVSSDASERIRHLISKNIRGFGSEILEEAYGIRSWQMTVESSFIRTREHSL